jgi:hypothetical protein
VAGSVALNTVPPVTLPPCIIFSLTGFHTCEPVGGLNAGPYFQLAGLNAPWLIAPAGATARALLSFPAGAANGNCRVPAAALLAYGSAVGVCGCGGGCCCGFCVWAPNVAMPSSVNTAA